MLNYHNWNCDTQGRVLVCKEETSKSVFQISVSSLLNLQHPADCVNFLFSCYRTYECCQYTGQLVLNPSLFLEYLQFLPILFLPISLCKNIFSISFVFNYEAPFPQCMHVYFCFVQMPWVFLSTKTFSSLLFFIMYFDSLLVISGEQKLDYFCSSD